MPALAGSTHHSLDFVLSALSSCISIREITFNPHSWQEVYFIKKKLHIILYCSLILLMYVLFHFRRSFRKWPFLRKFGCTWKFAPEPCVTPDSKGNHCISFLLSLYKWNQTLGKYHSLWCQKSSDHIYNIKLLNNRFQTLLPSSLAAQIWCLEVVICCKIGSSVVRLHNSCPEQPDVHMDS